VQRLPLIILLLSICSVSQTPVPTPSDGRISGTVVNEDGKPVPGAAVCVSLDSQEDSPFSLVDLRNSTVARTDAAGRFDFGRKLKHGFYEIYARKDKDGYPDPTSKFYQPLNFSVQNVQLYGDHPAENVTVQLSEKAAILAGRVYDATTGLPLKAEVGFSNLQTNAGRHAKAADGKFSELIPANTDVIVLVGKVHSEAGGSFGGPNGPEWSLFTIKVNLRPGQRMDIDVPLYKTATLPDNPQ
jgi:Carboxypeptidase regulatory-like domain